MDAVSSSSKKESDSNSVDIVMLGVGPFSSSRSAKFQLCAALCLHEESKVAGDIYVYDPMMNALEKAICEKLQIRVIEVNEEGKRKVIHPTLFYMPHCGKALYNNVIWANWECLSSIALIGNDWTPYIERNKDALSVSSLVAALPCTSSSEWSPSEDVVERLNLVCISLSSLCHSLSLTACISLNLFHLFSHLSSVLFPSFPLSPHTSTSL